MKGFFLCNGDMGVNYFKRLRQLLNTEQNEFDFYK